MTLAQMFVALLILGALLTATTFVDWPSIASAADDFAVRMAGWWMPVWEVVVEPWL